MNKILESTKFVVDAARFVHINHDNATAFGRQFDYGDIKHWLSLAPFDFSDFTEDQKLHFLVLFNALSFSYWGEPKWTIEYDGNFYDGAWGLIVALGRAIAAGSNLLDFAYCASIPRTDLQRILLGNVEIPLFEERWQMLREIGTRMIASFHGRARECIEAAHGDTQVLLDQIQENFPSFRDTATYQGQAVYFGKRAQLLIVDVYQFFGGRGIGQFGNIDQITACADYKLPQILRKLGILEYTPALAHKIDNKIEIDAGSPEEVEIRASTIWAVEAIKREVYKRNQQIRSFEINDHLWLATQEKFPDDKPYHRTRTTKY